MRSDTPKSLHKIAGLPLVGYVIRTMRAAGVDEVVVVASPEMADSSEFRAALAPGVRIAIQAEQRGTADALIAASEAARSADIVLLALVDMVLVTEELFRTLIDTHVEKGAAVTVLGARVADPSGFGRITVDGTGRPISILEDHEADDELRRSNLVNTSVYCFDNRWIWDQLESIKPVENGEIYLTKVVELAARVGRSTMVVADDPEVGLGINDRVQLANVERIIRRKINEFHMRNGVRIFDPATTYIDLDVGIGRDTEIGTGTHIGLGVTIGTNVVIGPNTQISSSTIGDGARVDGARVFDSIVGDGARVGTNSLLRSGTELKPGAIVGNLAEIKKSVIGSGSHVSHFSYVGDATVGDNVNIGAGTITCNYDGKDKHRTIIENGALIGSSTMLIAPVTIGRSARTGAGSVVRSNVAPGDTVAGVPAKSIKSK